MVVPFAVASGDVNRLKIRRREVEFPKRVLGVGKAKRHARSLVDSSQPRHALAATMLGAADGSS